MPFRRKGILTFRRRSRCTGHCCHCVHRRCGCRKVARDALQHATQRRAVRVGLLWVGQPGQNHARLTRLQQHVELALQPGVGTTTQPPLKPHGCTQPGTLVVGAGADLKHRRIGALANLQHVSDVAAHHNFHFSKHQVEELPVGLHGAAAGAGRQRGLVARAPHPLQLHAHGFVGGTPQPVLNKTPQRSGCLRLTLRERKVSVRVRKVELAGPSDGQLALHLSARKPKRVAKVLVAHRQQCRRLLHACSGRAVTH